MYENATSAKMGFIELCGPLYLFQVSVNLVKELLITVLVAFHILEVLNEEDNQLRSFLAKRKLRMHVLNY